MSSDNVVAETKDETEEPVDLIPTLIPLPPDEVWMCIMRRFDFRILVVITVIVIKTVWHLSAFLKSCLRCCDWISLYGVITINSAICVGWDVKPQLDQLIQLAVLIVICWSISVHFPMLSQLLLFVEIALLTCYPHMPIGKVWIYRLLFVCVCLYGYGFLRRG